MSNSSESLNFPRVRKPFSSLLKLQFRVSYSLSGTAERMGLGSKKKVVLYLYFGLLALALIPFMGVLFKLSNVLSEAFVGMGQPGFVVILAIMSGQVMVIFLGFSQLMSALYDSSDLETLRALPLPPWQIMASKISVAYFTELLGVIMFAGPFFLSLGIQLKDVFYWVPGVFTLLLIPCIPIAISVLIIAVLMKFTARSPKKDWFRVLSGLVVFAFIMAFNYLNINMTQYGPEQFVQLLMENNGLVAAASKFYPILKWGAWALTGTSLSQKVLGFLLYAGVSVGVLVLLVSFSQRWFFEGATTGTVSAKKKERVTVEQQEGELAWPKAKSAFKAMLVKEHRLLVRNPTYLMTALMNLMMVPIVLVFGYIGGGGDLGEFLAAITGIPGVFDIALLILVAIHAATTGMNQISSAAVSREGQTFWISKIIPVSPVIQVRAKLVYSILFSCIQLLVLVAIGAIALKLDVFRVLILLFLGFLVSVPVNAICLLYDVSFPKLDWTDPQQAMKGNFGTMVAWLLNLLYIAALGAVVYGLIRWGVAYSWIYCVSGAIILASAYVFIRWLDNIAERRYAGI
ncbi:MAG: hypothetical protein KBI39_04825 [Firmicutes bacterium]|nr:hypothetical protein [Candidatus Fermentithermobacillaceae bacterium]HON86601.1 hypothetical protein [Bacillota bacterium]HOV65674.1 hypothetical protein [Bacillota bacterium]